jgi:hypothetical protein
MTSPSALPPDRRTRRSSRVAWLIAACSTLLSATAHAEDAVELDWSAPPGCPDAAEVHERIRALAGENLRTKERLRATGRIEHRGARFRLTLTVRDGESVGERTVDSDACTDLAGAAAIALGLLLEDKRQAEAAATQTKPGKGEPSANPTAPPGPNSQPNDATSDIPPANSDDGGERSFHALVLLPLPTLDIGPLPKPSLGLGAGLGAKLAGWRALAIARYYSTVEILASDYPAGADVDRLSAELWTCHGFRAGRFELAPCLTGSLAHYTARGTGVDVAPRSARTVAFALGGGIAVDVHLFDWLALSATAAVRAETSRPRLTIDDFGEVRKLGAAQASFPPRTPPSRRTTRPGGYRPAPGSAGTAPPRRPAPPRW